MAGAPLIVVCKSCEHFDVDDAAAERLINPRACVKCNGNLVLACSLRDYYDWLTEKFGCMVCRRPPQIHHVVGGSISSDLQIRRGMGQKNSDWLVIPLCMDHHTGREGLHIIGVRTWESRFGSQLQFLETVNSQLGSADLFEKAGLARRREIAS